MLFLKQPLISPFLCHKSASTCQIDSNKVSNSMLKPDLCNCIKTEMIESIAPLQQPNKRGTIFWDIPYKQTFVGCSKWCISVCQLVKSRLVNPLQ